MDTNQATYDIVFGLLLLGSLTAGTAYALMFAAGADAPWPSGVLRLTWRIGCLLVKTLLLTILLLVCLLLGGAPLVLVIVIGWGIWRYILSPARLRRLQRLVPSEVEDWT